MHRPLLAALLALPLGFGVSPAVADTVWTLASGPNAKPFPRKNVKIEGISADGLLFRSVSQDRAAEPRPLTEIHHLEVDDEPALNAAETAYVAQKWDDAVAGYQKTIGASRKDWVKQFATIRLITAAEKSGKFSAAASAYAALVQRDVKSAENAKPDIPKDKKAELPPAINAVKAALGNARLAAPQKAALQAFLAELYIANGQLKEAQSLDSSSPAAVTAAPAPTPTGAARRETGTPAAPAPAAPAANKGQIDLKLQLARASLEQKKYQDAIDAIDSVAPSLTEPAQQADALFCVAEAKAGLAGDDPAKLKDAALAYMRIVAHFKDDADAPHVAEALYKTGAMLEQAKLLPDALAAYQAVQAEHKGAPQAKEAAAAAARVQKAIEEARS
jgi:hypothetical protein